MKSSIVLLLFFYGCTEINTKETNLSKYPEISTFIIDSSDVITRHDYDNGHIVFKFSVAASEMYLKHVDSVAIAEKWNFESSSDSGRVFTKLIQSFPADDAFDTIDISVDKKQAYLKWY